jgi:hypothetical protein
LVKPCPGLEAFTLLKKSLVPFKRKLKGHFRQESKEQLLQHPKKREEKLIN